MQASSATWADVKVGSHIKDRNGEAWKVVKSKSGFWGIQNRSGVQKIIPAPAADRAVQIMYLTQAELESMLIETLGAETHSWKLAGQTIYTTKPFEPLRIEEMKSHLWLMHGVPTISVNDPGQPAGMNSKKALIECHAAKHLKPHKERWTPHVHLNPAKES